MGGKRANSGKLERRSRVAKKPNQISVRLTEAMAAFLKKKSPMADGQAALARIALETFKDIYEGLGDNWWEVVRRASASEQSPGTVVASIVRAQLEAERKAKK